jgi:hypothetical protein
MWRMIEGQGVGVIFLHSVVSYDRSITCSKESSPHSAIYCCLFQSSVPCRFLKVIPVTAYVFFFVFSSLLHFLYLSFDNVF